MCIVFSWCLGFSKSFSPLSILFLSRHVRHVSCFLCSSGALSRDMKQCRVEELEDTFTCVP